MHSSKSLATWHPRGLLDAAQTREILAFVESEETTTENSFDRFTDLSGLASIKLSFAEVEQLVIRRTNNYHGRRVKSAIFASNPLAFGIARMYEQLMWRSPIEVAVSSELESAATWLGVPMDCLAPES